MFDHDYILLVMVIAHMFAMQRYDFFSTFANLLSFFSQNTEKFCNLEAKTALWSVLLTTFCIKLYLLRRKDKVGCDAHIAGFGNRFADSTCQFVARQ